MGTEPMAKSGRLSPKSSSLCTEPPEHSTHRKHIQNINIVQIFSIVLPSPQQPQEFSPSAEQPQGSSPHCSVCRNEGRAGAREMAQGLRFWPACVQPWLYPQNCMWSPAQEKSLRANFQGWLTPGHPGQELQPPVFSRVTSLRKPGWGVV